MDLIHTLFIENTNPIAIPFLFALVGLLVALTLDHAIWWQQWVRLQALGSDEYLARRYGEHAEPLTVLAWAFLFVVTFFVIGVWTLLPRISAALWNHWEHELAHPSMHRPAFYYGDKLDEQHEIIEQNRALYQEQLRQERERRGIM